ncbi:hypothetical protein Poli38472_009193 [Pythium oligandrum]|uniref:JmjC domain-containing protein n=1 Tax=Pythium oligandrum TaxID=41045 RepID=A0A8K1FJK4_PYTOL|nr:hypothetical protein Poli38472_009193 [Pythium oligandrum]|eukprot:TMW65026.1 hypothetical protein Poli38472_009193 [Pythium oligandrum]
MIRTSSSSVVEEVVAIVVADIGTGDGLRPAEIELDDDGEEDVTTSRGSTVTSLSTEKNLSSVEPSTEINGMETDSNARQATPEESFSESLTGSKTTAQQIAALEAQEAVDVPPTTLDDELPTPRDLDLGPVEDLDGEVFDVVVRDLLPAKAEEPVATKQVVVCKFCNEEFTYLLRDKIHSHKSQCLEFQHQKQASADEEELPSLGMAVDDQESVAMMEEDGDQDMSFEPNEADSSDIEENELTQLMDEDMPPADTEPIMESEEEHVAEGGKDTETPAQVPEEQERGENDNANEPGDGHAVTEEVSTSAQANPEVAAEDAAEAEEVESSSEYKAHLCSHGKDPSPEKQIVSPGDYRVFDDGKHAECRYCQCKVVNRGTSRAQHADQCQERLKYLENNGGSAHQVESGSVDRNPTITPKKKASKRKNSIEETEVMSDTHSIHSSGHQGKHDDEEEGDPPFPRRSKRLKHDAKPHDGGLSSAPQEKEGILDQFESVEVGRAKKLRCKHCGHEIGDRKGKETQAERHLSECKAFKTRHERIGDVVARVSHLADAIRQQGNGGKNGSSSSAAAKAMQAVGDAVVERAMSPTPANQSAQVSVALSDHEQVSEILKMDTVTALSWIFGDATNADQMKVSYRRSPLRVLGPVARFKPLVKSLLFDLDVHKLLGNASPTDNMKVLIESPGDVRRTTFLPVESATQAWQLYQSGFSISFRAPEAVKQIMVTPLAADLGLGPFVSTEMHDVKLICGRAGQLLDWQFHRSDSFMICLTGQALWRMKKTNIKQPVRCFHPFTKSLEEAEDNVKAQRAVLHVSDGNVSVIAPPNDDTHLFTNTDDDELDTSEDGVDNGHQEAMTEPGSVLYIPAATWYQADGLENDVWLQIQMHSVSYADVMADAVRQLLWSETAWREPVLSTSDSSKPTRQHVATILQGLTRKLQELKPSDVVPELLLHPSDELPFEVMHDPETGISGKSYEFDLTQGESFPPGKVLKIFKGSMFRMNPLAVLMNVDELPHDRSSALTRPASTPSSGKKALNRKPKRRTSLVGTKHKGESVYVLHVSFGNSAFQSRLRVQFRCNRVQIMLIEWMRTHASSEAFHVVDMFKLMQKPREGSGNVSQHEDELKYLLRFLCGVGYLTQVKIPL